MSRSRSLRALLALALLPALTSTDAHAAPAKKPVVAVFTLDAKGVALDEPTRDRLSDYFATRLAASGRYQVVPRADLKRRLQGQKKTSYKSCYDSSCQIEIGKELAAEKSLATQVIKLGSRCAVTATLFDLRRAATEAAATAKGACGEDALVSSIEEVVNKLVSKATSQETTPTPSKPTTAPPPKPTPTPAKRTPPTMDERRERSEWITVTMLPGLINGPDDPLVIAGGSISLFTLKWKIAGNVYLAWTALEVTLCAAFADSDVLYGTLSSGLHLPIYFGEDETHSMRFGAMLGVGAAGEQVGFVPTLEAEYRYQTKGRIFFGLGGRLVLPAFTASSTDFNTDRTSKYWGGAAFLMLRLGWAATP